MVILSFQEQDLNARQRRTLEAVFTDPTPANIRWNALEALVKGLGGVVDRGREGSRVGLYLRGKAAVLHRPHPTPETPRSAVRAVRELLVKAGVTPTESPRGNPDGDHDA